MKRIIYLVGCILFCSLCGWTQVGNFAVRSLMAARTTNVANPEQTTIPAGTHILMKLSSPLHTTSAVQGSGVYLETAYPVVQNNRVVIPAGTRVMGEVENSRRPGRVRGRSRLRLRFTSFILPDNSVLAIAGNLQSLPGSSDQRTVDNEGTVEPVDQIDADVYTVAKGTLPGMLIGGLIRGGTGALAGGAIGAGLGVATVLFKRGDPVSLPVGTRVEMVLRRNLTLNSATIPAVQGSD